MSAPPGKIYNSPLFQSTQMNESIHYHILNMLLKNVGFLYVANCKFIGDLEAEIAVTLKLFFDWSEVSFFLSRSDMKPINEVLTACVLLFQMNAHCDLKALY